MARGTMIETGAGFIPEPGPIQTIDGKLTEQGSAALSAFVMAVVKALNGNLSLGDGTRSARAGNLDACRVEHYFAAANVIEEIPHRLGRVPSGWLVVDQSVAGSLYRAPERAWTASNVYLKSSAGTALWAFFVF